MAYNNFLKGNYDMYRINFIKVKVIPECNVSTTSTGGTLPTMKVVYDWDDSSAPTVGDVEIRRGKTYLLNKPFSFKFKPRIGVNCYTNSADPTGFLVQKAPWINMAYPNVNHYGPKFMIRDWYCNNLPNDIQVRIIITYGVSVKNQLQINRAPSLQNDDAPEGVDGADAILLEPEAPYDASGMVLTQPPKAP